MKINKEKSIELIEENIDMLQFLIEGDSCKILKN